MTSSDDIAHPSGPGVDPADRPAPVPPPDDEVRAHLDKILGSAVLRGSERLRRFLRLVVEETLSGRGDRLKEYVLGVEALERPASFDPRTDAVVRVEARRLRMKLAEYYGSEGARDEVVIDLPKGSYTAAFSRPPTAAPPCEEAAGPAVEEPEDGRVRPPRRLARMTWSLLAGILMLAVTGSWLLSRSGRSQPSAPTIAVLPFANASADQDNEYFCFGLVEDLTTALAQTRGLRVIARTSATRFSGSQDAREIGRRLTANFIVEGSVRREGDRLRITAQLIDTAAGAQVWAEAYDRNVRDLLATQSEIARSVAGALGPRLAGARPPAPGAALDPAAHQLFLKGQYFMNTVEKDAPEKALAYLQQAVALAPGFAPAHAALAAAYAKITLDRPAPRLEEIERARAEAREALSIDDSAADAHALLAWIAFFYEWNWTESERGFRRALELNPNSATARHRYALLLMATRRFDEALAMSRLAADLDPLSALVASNRAMILLCSRRYDEAIAQGKAALELAPGAFATYTLIGSSHAQTGRFQEAAAAYRAALALAPDDGDAGCSLARALAISGRRNEAETMLTALRAPSRRQPPSHYETAFAQAALGDRDGAMASLAASRAAHETELVYLDVDPLFDQLRADPRFATFVASLQAGQR